MRNADWLQSRSWQRHQSAIRNPQSEIDRLLIAECGMRIGFNQEAGKDTNPQSEIRNPKSIDCSLLNAECGLASIKKLAKTPIRNPTSAIRNRSIAHCGMRIGFNQE